MIQKWNYIAVWKRDLHPTESYTDYHHVVQTCYGNFQESSGIRKEIRCGLALE